MIEFEYEKRENTYWVKGKAKPCSSRMKMMTFVTREFLRHSANVKKGRIIIEMDTE